MTDPKIDLRKTTAWEAWCLDCDWTAAFLTEYEAREAQDEHETECER